MEVKTKTLLLYNYYGTVSSYNIFIIVTRNGLKWNIKVVNETLTCRYIT